MNKLIKGNTLLAYILMIGLSWNVRAQDAVFSQFYNASLYLNPALAGDEQNIVLNASYRSQWRNLHFPYTTSQASLIVPYYQDKHKTPKGHKGGFGISVFNDVAGAYSNFLTIGGNLSWAYNLVLDRKANNKLSFALQGGFIQKGVDPNKLQWGEQYNRFVGFDPSIEPVNVDDIGKRTYFDLTSGIFWRYQPVGRRSKKLVRTAYSGLSVAHMNNPDESIIKGQLNKLPLLYKYHGGMVFRTSKSASISANVLTMYQDTQFQTNIGSYFSYSIPLYAGGVYSEFLFRAGGWYRINDSFIANLELVLDKYKVGFSYDWNVSSLRYSNRGVGAYEVTLGINFTRYAPPKVRY